MPKTIYTVYYKFKLKILLFILKKRQSPKYILLYHKDTTK